MSPPPQASLARSSLLKMGVRIAIVIALTTLVSYLNIFRLITDGEASILVAPWGFPLEEIRTEVHLWYWEGDTIVPPQMGRYLASRLPRAVPHFLPGGGHFSIFTHWKDILAPLVRPE